VDINAYICPNKKSIMISKDIISACFDALDQEEVEITFNSPHDYILFECLSCGIVRITPHDYDEDLAEETQSEGNIFCDKDAFLYLFKESDSQNPYLIELI